MAGLHTRKPLSGVRLCYVSIGNFGGVWRTWKQARSLAEAGAEVYIVGYKEAIPDALAKSGHRVVAVPAGPPGPPTPPEPPAMPSPPSPLAPVIWRSSENRLRVVRALANRTINQVQYRIRSREARRSHQREVRQHDSAVRQYQQALYQHELDVQRHAVAERKYWESLDSPPPWYEAEAHPSLVQAVVETRANLVQAVDLTALGVAAMAAEALGAGLIYATHELWAGFLNNPHAPANPHDAQGLLAMERRLIRAADLVTVTSDQMGERLVEMYDIRRPLTLLNSPPSRVQTPAPVSRPVRLVFHGGLSQDRNIRDLIVAVGLIRDVATLDIHGYNRTATAEDLQGLIAELGLDGTVRVHGSFYYLGVVDLISKYDIGVMAAKVIEENFEVTLPNKVFDCMCAGLAIAMYDSAAIRALLSEVPFGITLDPSGPETIARDLKNLVDDPARIARMKEVAVEAAPKYWWPEQERSLITAVRRLCPNRMDRLKTSLRGERRDPR